MVTVIRYKCPYCQKESITKKLEPKQCPKCHNKLKKPIEIVNKVEV